MMGTWLLRDEQIRRLARNRRHRFERGLADHLQETWPERSDALGRKGVEELVHEALLRAFFHGFSTERDVRRFVKLAFVLGPEFDRVPATASWVRPVLADVSLTPAVRMNRLWDRALHELERRAAEERDV